MANPRKFSEKIALHNHRQAEETAAFEQIMKEVIEVTNKDEVPHGNRSPSGGGGGSTSPGACGAYRPGEGRSRARSQGGPIRRPHDRRTDTSPYSSAAYLSPPTDTGWRRTNSDSALHQSTMQGMADRNNDNSNRGWNMPMMNGPDRSLDGRPRSSCDIPSSSSRVPGISIHPSVHDPGMIQIPIGNNTGSLPDLTNVDFSSPIRAPLDQDHDSSPYSSSPVNTSPSTLSPTSIPTGVRQLGRFHFTPDSHAHSNHLSVPLNSRYQPPHHINKNVQLDKNLVNLVDTDFTQLHNMTGMYQQQQQPCPRTSASPTLQQTASYRSPRPSPQSSPSPGGRHSAPCSPGAPSPLPNDYQMLNQQASTQFQQHFEQLSMLDNPPNTISYVDQSPSGGHHHQHQGMQQMQQQTHHPQDNNCNNSLGGGGQNICNNVEQQLGSDPGYYSTSPPQQPLIYPSASPGAMHTTPNTPTSLPEIILTDFSSVDMLRQFSEETLKEGLGSLDFDELQILTNPSMSIPETVEDNFRLDHRS